MDLLARVAHFEKGDKVTLLAKEFVILEEKKTMCWFI
jgi:hypothetical protein